MKTGLIMEGGAMRGLFTCGVIDVFMEEGITFDGAAGVSAGAVFGANYKSRQIGRGVRYNKRFCSDWRFGSMRSFLHSGDVFDVEFGYHEIPEKLDIFDREAFAQNPMEFWLAATNVETGMPEYYRCDDGGALDIEWMRASASIPLLSNVVEIGDKKLLDGGTAMPVPYHYMKSLGYDRMVTVLTQPEDYRKKPLPGLPAVKMRLRKYPALYTALKNRPNRYNALYADLAERGRSGETIIIRPKEKLGIGSMETDPNELERVYQLGRAAAYEKLDEVKRFLGQE